MLIPSNEYRRERWKNGLGWTREIYRFPASGEDWDWRLSIAEITSDGPFSAFAGYDRELVLLSGAGMRLSFADGEVVELAPPRGRHRFAGERNVSAELLEGPTHDFNAIWRRDRVETTVLHRPLVGTMVFFVEPGECWVVHLLGGRAELKDQSASVHLEQGDSAVLRPFLDERSRMILDGGGEVLLIKFKNLAGEVG